MDERPTGAWQSVDERRERGRSARQQVPRSAHGDWAPSPDRPDPVELLAQQNLSRVPWLVPVRHARMRVSAFTFYRGAARIMASDLAGTPTSGLHVQLGGDAHLSNFGGYASPERRLVFDQNDFDETLPGPWEWDLKRLATSVMIAGQHLGMGTGACRRATDTVTRSYREAMGRLAGLGLLELWYDHVDVEQLRQGTGLPTPELRERVARFQRKAVRRDSFQAAEKLTEVVDGRQRIRSEPPVLLPLRDLPDEYDPDALEDVAVGTYEDYKQSIEDHRHAFLDRYRVVDIGVKVVGVGSVGTRCLIVLLAGRDDADPLFLQIKEAGPSVLEDHLPPSRYDHHGRRVVEGQRLVQAQSDSFLGWTTGRGADRRHFYVRQLRDWKGSADVERATPDQLAFYAGMCGMTLARGHARSGDAAAIQAYAGKGDALDRAVTRFAEAYSAQNALDHQRFCDAIDAGRLECGPLV